MNTRFPTALVATTQTTSGTIVFDAAPVSFSAHPNTELVDGETYPFFMRWPDNSTAGFLEGFGVYSSAGNGSITRAIITKSTNGEGADYTFAAGTKHLAITAPGSSLAIMASILADLEPWEDILIWATGQSNLNNAHFYSAGATQQTANPNIEDYSTNGASAASQPTTYDDLDWRVPVLTDDYTDNVTDYKAANTAIYTGVSRSHYIALAAAVVRIGSIPYAFADALQKMSGRKVRIVSTFRDGTSLTEANGWMYPSGATGLKATDTLKAAIARMHVLDPTQSTVTAPHFVLMAQGETDRSNGVTSGAYGNSLWRFIESCEAGAGLGWNVTDAAKTKYLFMDLPPKVQQIDPSFNGHRVAAELIGSRAQVVSTEGATTYDNVPGPGTHYHGQAADLLGKRSALAIVTPVERMSADAAFKVSADAATLNSIYTTGNPLSSNSAPAAGTYNVDTNGLKLKIQDAGFGTGLTAQGAHYLKPGDTLVFTKTGAPAGSRTYTITGTCVINGTVLEFPVSATTSSTGTPPVATDAITIGSSALVNNGTVSARSDLSIGSGTLAQRTTDATRLPLYPSYATLDQYGNFTRAIKQTHQTRKRWASTAAALNFTSTLSMSVNSQVFVEVTTVAFLESTKTPIYVNKYRGIAKMGAAAADSPTLTHLEIEGTAASAAGKDYLDTNSMPAMSFATADTGRIYAYNNALSGTPTVWTVVWDVIVLEAET
jgi:hypothetical protein